MATQARFLLQRVQWLVSLPFLFQDSSGGTDCHVHFSITLDRFDFLQKGFPFQDGSVEPSMSSRDCLELSWD
jgi:hypothetical protein